MAFFNSFVPTFKPLIAVAFFALMAWSVAWKGMALWKASKNNDLKWFIALLVVNTMGILEILYIYIFSKKKGQS